jgi:hypothetical protein
MRAPLVPTGLTERVRSFVRLPLATSVSRSSLTVALVEIIPASLMGHVADDRAQGLAQVGGIRPPAPFSQTSSQQFSIGP